MMLETKNPGAAVGAATGVDLHRDEGGGYFVDIAEHREKQARVLAERYSLALAHARAVVDLHLAGPRP